MTAALPSSIFTSNQVHLKPVDHVGQNRRKTMLNILKWGGIFIGSVLALFVLGVLGMSFSANARLNRMYDIQPEPLTIPTDAESIEEGRRLASIYCASCHGKDMAGEEVFNDPALAVIAAPNLTAGNGGFAALHRDEDWVRALRHGVDPDGRALLIMPSKDFYHFSDEDLGQIIAYLKSAQPVDKHSQDVQVTLIGKVLIAAGAFGDILNAETIDHNAWRPSAPAPAVTSEYGDYLVRTFGCRTCHGEQLAGGKDPNPEAPDGPNLTPGGSLGAWSQQDFIHIVRARRSEWMPFESLRIMSDDELAAIYLYLQDQPVLKPPIK
jgi:mono/diheme cytochrome c family protein